MHALFTPAIALSNQLSFKAKFIFVTLLCALPLIFFFSRLAYYQVEQIDHAEYELKASRYIVPLRNLAEHIAQTRGMTNAYLNGNQSFHSKIIAKRRTADQDFEQLLNIDRELGEALGTSRLPRELQQRWQQHNSRAFDNPATDTFQEYSLLIADILDFMDTIGRQGHMIQESDPASSYLISSLLHTIPAQVESLGVLRGKGSGIIAANALTTDNKLQIAMLADTRNARILKKDIDYLFEAEPELKKVLARKYDDAIQRLEDYLKLAEREIIQASSANMDSAEFFSRGTQTISALLSLFDSMQVSLGQRMEQQITEAKQQVSIYLALIIIVITLLIYIYIGIYLAIRKNLDALQQTADRICDGDLKVRLRLDTRDEMRAIASSFNDIAEGVNRSIAAIKKSSEEIALTAEQIAAQSTQTANGMLTQSQELSQTSTAVTEMTASVNEVAQNTEQASVAAQDSNQQAVQGNRVVKQTISAINTLASNIHRVVEGVSTLEENSNNITGILDVIRGVAEQTNLLALNAAIEAARAGEQGRGFAVVADEVRTLASRTQDSTLEIQAMIELIQGGIGEVAQAMNESQQHANTAVEHSNEAGEMLQAIASSVEQISNMTAQIATAAVEQSSVSEEIARSIVTIDDVAGETSHSAQALAGTSTQLSEMSGEMNREVSRYQIN